MFTTVCWLAAAYLGPQTDTATLVEFYRKVRPVRPRLDAHRQGGWRLRRRTAKPTARGANIPLSLLGWSTGCAMIWSALFTVGNFLYGRIGYAVGLAAVFAATGAVLVAVVRRLWIEAGSR